MREILMNKEALLLMAMLILSGCQSCVQTGSMQKRHLEAKQTLATPMQGKNYVYCNRCLPQMKKECQIKLTK